MNIDFLAKLRLKITLKYYSKECTLSFRGRKFIPAELVLKRFLLGLKGRKYTTWLLRNIISVLVLQPGNTLKMLYPKNEFFIRASSLLNKICLSQFWSHPRVSLKCKLSLHFFKGPVLCSTENNGRTSFSTCEMKVRQRPSSMESDCNYSSYNYYRLLSVAPSNGNVCLLFYGRHFSFSKVIDEDMLNLLWNHEVNMIW